MNRSPKFISFLSSILRPFLKFYFRYEITGLSEIRDRPYLFIANHNAGASAEVLILLCAWEKDTDKKIPVYALAHKFVFTNPLTRIFFEALGSVPASYDDAYEVLHSGASLIIFPGGERQVMRPLWKDEERHFYGRLGWAKIAINSKVPVVPIKIDGSHFTNPVFFQSEILSWLLVLPRIMGVKRFPLSVSQVFFTSLALYFGPHGSPWVLGLLAYTCFGIAPLVPILPFKIKIDFLSPISTDNLTPEQLSDKVIAAISNKAVGKSSL